MNFFIFINCVVAACLGTDDGIDEAVGAEQTTCFGWGTLLLAVIHGALNVVALGTDLLVVILEVMEVMER